MDALPASDRTKRALIIQRLAQMLRDLELIYNYLAFVAAPYSSAKVIDAYHLHDALERDRDNVFQRLRLYKSSHTAVLA